MKVFNFYFVRHAQSYANLYTDMMYQNILDLNIFEAIDNYKKKSEKDPHLTDKGIINSLIANIQISDLLPKFNYRFVSPLIRTYETALLMFDYNSYIIGPYLRENPPFDILLANDDIAKTYNEYILRTNNFKKYMKKFIKDNKINQIEKTKVNRLENYDNTINMYTDNGNLENFIIWFINKYNTIIQKETDILTICHSNLIRTLVKNYDKDLYDDNKEVFSNNNFIIKVNVICNNNIIINNIELIYHGL